MDYIGIALGIISSALAALVLAYLRKKGENWATHDDIANITKEVESVKADINLVLHTQKGLWEEKKRALLDLVKAIQEMQAFILNIAFNMELYGTKNIKVYAGEANQVMIKLMQTKALVDVFVEDPKTKQQAEVAAKIINDLLTDYMGFLSEWFIRWGKKETEYDLYIALHTHQEKVVNAKLVNTIQPQINAFHQRCRQYLKQKLDLA